MSKRGNPSRMLVGALTLMVTAMLVLSACGNAEPDPEKSAAPKPPALIRVSVYGPSEVTTAYAELAAAYTAKHPDTIVQVLPSPTEEAARQANNERREAGKSPDLFLMNVEQLPELMAARAIQPVDQPLENRDIDFGDSYQRDALEAFSRDTALQCMPVEVSPMVAYYNRALINLDRPLPPEISPINPAKGWSIDQFRAALKAMLTPRSTALGMSASLEQLAPFIWSGGGELVDDSQDPEELTLSEPASEAALETLLTIVRDPSLNLSQAQLQKRPALQRFKNGRLGVMFGYRDLVPELRATANLDFDVLPMPRIGRLATVYRMNGLCLSATTKNAERAADFLAHAVSDDSATILARTGYVVPTNTKVLVSSDFLQPDQRPVNARTYYTVLKGGRLLPETNRWVDLETSVNPMLVALFTDPVIDPLADRLEAIDQTGSLILNPPTPTPSPTPSPSRGGTN
ncbi:MAG TPA: extracellular solute-binding protein [Marmoricola sp.]|nr:extracellular solute-binding protein [Marmoricola sp.]HNI69737.1 extracellular solute-binding protein [Marmoricola sp.]